MPQKIPVLILCSIKTLLCPSPSPHAGVKAPFMKCAVSEQREGLFIHRVELYRSRTQLRTQSSLNIQRTKGCGPHPDSLPTSNSPFKECVCVCLCVWTGSREGRNHCCMSFILKCFRASVIKRSLRDERMEHIHVCRRCSTNICRRRSLRV